MDTVGEGEGRMNWERSIDIHTLPCVTQITSGKLLYNTGSPASILWWLRGMGVGKEGIWYDCGWFALYGRNQHNIIKSLCYAKSLRTQLFVTPWTVARQAPLSMEFSRQEDWSGLPFPSPGDLSDPRIEPMSLTSPALAGGIFITSATFSNKKIKSTYVQICTCKYE